MSKWSKIYRKQMSESPSLKTFINDKLSYKKPLLEVIKKYSNNKKILEIGCGSGISTTFLAQQGFHVVGIDSDRDMIELATQISAQQKSSSVFMLDDIKTLDKIHEHFDVIFSNGVMEHFSDKQIVAIVNRHLLVCDYVIISIPSDYFSDSQKIYGDERFMDVSKWRLILSKTKGIIIEEFSFGHNKISSSKPEFIGFVLRPL